MLVEPFSFVVNSFRHTWYGINKMILDLSKEKKQVSHCRTDLDFYLGIGRMLGYLSGQDKWQIRGEKAPSIRLLSEFR